MNDKTREALLEREAGKLTIGASDLANVQQQGNAPEAPVPEMPQGNIQLASFTGKALGRLFKKAPVVIKQELKNETEELSKEEAEAILQSYVKSRSEGQPVDADITRVLTAAETSDDLLRMAEIAAESDPKVARRTWEQVQKESNIPKDLEPILTGKQKGLLTDKQLYGLRTLMVTVGEKTVNLANRIHNGDSSAATLAEFEANLQSFLSLRNLAKGNAREVARALNQQKMIVKAVDSGQIAALNDVLDLQNGKKNISAIAESIVTEQKKNKNVIKSLADAVDKGWVLDARRAIVELWKNNILSGIGTHMTNVTTVALTHVWETLAVRPTAAGIGALRTVYKEDADRVYMAEVMGEMAGSYVGLKASLGLFMDAFTTNRSKFRGIEKAESLAGGDTAVHKTAENLARAVGNVTGSQKAMEITGKVGGIAADFGTASFRLLTAEDDAMRGVVFTSELYARAVRQAYMEGLKGEKALERAAELVDNPPVEMYNDAMKEAMRRTFTSPDVPGIIGEISRYSRAMMGRVPELQFVIPFVNTPANLLNYAKDTSILAVVSPRLWRDVAEGGAKADLALARMALGTGFTVAMYQLYQAGLISGQGPTDKGLREELQKLGWQPVSIKIGDKWYSMQRMDPFATSMSAIATYFDRAKYASTEEAARAWMASAFLVAADVALDSSWLSNTAQLMDALDAPKAADEFMSRIGAGFVPYSAAVRTAEQIRDPVYRLVTNDAMSPKSLIDLTVDRMKTNIPFLSDKMRPKRWWDGTIAEPDMGGFAFALSPVKVTESKHDKPTEELVKYGISIEHPRPILNMGGVKISLIDLGNGSDALYDIYLAFIGNGRKETISTIINESDYIEGQPFVKSYELQLGSIVGKEIGVANFLDFVKNNADILIEKGILNPGILMGEGETLDGFVERFIDVLDEEISFHQQRAYELETGIKIQHNIVPEREGTIPLP